MSSKGIYSAVSGAMAQASKLDTIANNLANVNTTSFKKDRQVFSEYLSAYEKPDESMKVPRVVASIESFYDMQGGDNSYVNPSGTYTNFAQGGLKSTGSPMDVALEGDDKKITAALKKQNKKERESGQRLLNFDAEGPTTSAQFAAAVKNIDKVDDASLVVDPVHRHQQRFTRRTGEG